MKKLIIVLATFLVGCSSKSDVHYYMEDVLYEVQDALESKGIEVDYEVIPERNGDMGDVLAKGYYSTKDNKITVFSAGRDSCDALEVIYHELGHKLYFCSLLMASEYVNKEGEVFAEMFAKSFEKTPGAAMQTGLNLWNKGYAEAFPQGHIGYNTDRILYYFYHVSNTELYDTLERIREKYKPNCGTTVVKKNQTVIVRVKANGDEEITIQGNE